MDKPRGRPPLPPDQRRSRTILVSVTEGELARLSQHGRPSKVLRGLLDTLLGHTDLLTGAAPSIDPEP